MPFKFGLQRILEREEGDVYNALKWLKNNWRFKIWRIELDPQVYNQQLTSAREIIEKIVSEYANGVGKPAPEVWVDHTPQNIRYTQLLVDLFPEARMVHIVRDGRSVASSLMRVDWGPNNVEDAAHFWAESLCRGFAAELLWGPERIIRVRYEDLLREPEPTLKRLCAHVRVNYEPEMVQGMGLRVPRYTAANHSLVGSAPDPSRANAWERELTPRQVEIFESVAGDLLPCLGYPLQYGLGAKRISRKERFASNIHDIYRKALNWRRARRRIRLGLANR